MPADGEAAAEHRSQVERPRSDRIGHPDCCRRSACTASASPRRLWRSSRPHAAQRMADGFDRVADILLEREVLEGAELRRVLEEAEAAPEAVPS